MARRHLLLSQKIIGDEAVLHPATLEALEMSPEGGQILVTCSATYLVLKAVGKDSVSEHQIKLPLRAAAVLKEGERLTVQPAPLVQDTARSNGHAPPPALKGGPSGAHSSDGAAPARAAGGGEQAEGFEWDPISPADFEGIAGLGRVKDRIEQALFYLTHPEWFLVRRNLPPRVFLFFGPYGCGKTMLAKAMASRMAYEETDGKTLPVKFKAIRPTDIKDPYLGMSARRAQEFLDRARDECNRGSTIMLLLDEIDSVVSNRSDGNTHEEYRDVVNSLIQDIQGVRELDTESRIRALWSDPEVEEVRQEIAALVRKCGSKDQGGDISLPESRWTPEVRGRMLNLRERIVAEGGASTVIIVGTTNDPLRLDEAFLSRAGSNIFFVPRPSATAVEKMLADHLDSAFVEMSDQDRHALADAAFREGLTGRDIVLSWLQPLRSASPGSLRILGRQTVAARRPAPVVSIEWERDLLGRLEKRGQSSLATQVSEYLDEVFSATKRHEAGNAPATGGAGGTRRSGPAGGSKQPALL